MDLLLRCVERRRELEVEEPIFTVLALAGPEVVTRAEEDEDEDEREARLLGSSSGMGTKTFGTDLLGALTWGGGLRGTPAAVCPPAVVSEEGGADVERGLCVAAGRGAPASDEMELVEAEAGGGPGTGIPF